jgi:hypothetical protein
MLFGVIRAKLGNPPLTFEEWCTIVATREDLIPPSPRTGRNPKTGEAITINPRQDSAAVMADGQEIGSVGWSHGGENEVFVSGESRAIVLWGKMIASELDAEFFELPTREV